MFTSHAVIARGNQMIAYEIQLRYVIRDKIQSETKFLKKKKIIEKKSCWGKSSWTEFCLILNFILVQILSWISSAFFELSRTNRCLSSLSDIYIPQ